MIDKIIALDKYLFLKLNRDCQNTVFDFILPLLRAPLFWMPLYFFLLLYVGLRFKHKLLKWLGFALVTVSATDLISSKLIKPFFARPRPCADPDFFNQVRLLTKYCGANGSFTSSHATNHFGLAMFFSITLGHLFPRYKFLFFVWAFSICIAQVYVGVHYPTDVLCGALLGCLLGYIMGIYFNKNYFLNPQTT